MEKGEGFIIEEDFRNDAIYFMGSKGGDAMGEVIEFKKRSKTEEPHRVTLDGVFGALYWEVKKIHGLIGAKAPIEIKPETLNTLCYIHQHMDLLLNGLSKVSGIPRWR